jgi:surface carbohydrate biosynthesis protein
MSIIYLPIEISKRELIAKTFLATKLASYGHQVIVFESSIFDFAGWPYPGIYIGKNCFRTELPYSLNYYKKMKEADIAIWYLDEEGGIYNSMDKVHWSKMLLNRINPCDLDRKDKIFAWGSWQSEAYNVDKLMASIHITGSPNFDTMQEKYKESLKDFDLRQTNYEEDYILVNTRFSSSNGLRSIEWILSDATPNAKSLARGTLENAIINDGIVQYKLTGLVKQLAERLPSQKFIVRPHPVEDELFYKAIFKHLANVKVISDGDVSSWIRNCKLLIHNSCTTAIQADISNKKVITYKPEGLNNYEGPGLPDTIEIVCSNFSEVCEAIENNQHQSSQKMWSDTISELDSINSIAEIAKTSLNSKKYVRNLFSILNRKLFLFKILAWGKDKLRFLFKTKHIEHQINQQKFDPSYFLKSKDIFRSAKNFYNADVSFSYSKFNYFIIEPESQPDE